MSGLHGLLAEDGRFAQVISFPKPESEKKARQSMATNYLGRVPMSAKWQESQRLCGILIKEGSINIDARDLL